MQMDLVQNAFPTTSSQTTEHARMPHLVKVMILSLSSVFAEDISNMMLLLKNAWPKIV